MPNNYWDDIQGHAFEGENAYALVEGSVFENVKTPVTDNTASLYAPTSDDSACQSALGRACVGNSFSGSGTLEGTDSNVLSQIGSNAVDAVSASEISNIPGSAGNTL